MGAHDQIGRTERLRLETLFGLGGGELEDSRWEQNRFWYRGAPSYAERDLERQYDGAEFRTLLWDSGDYGDHTAPDLIQDIYGDWKLVQQFRSSGEVMCPQNGEKVTEPCGLCEEPLGAEHGYIYMGPGWSESVYRLEPYREPCLECSGPECRVCDGTGSVDAHRTALASFRYFAPEAYGLCVGCWVTPGAMIRYREGEAVNLGRVLDRVFRDGCGEKLPGIIHLRCLVASDNFGFGFIRYVALDRIVAVYSTDEAVGFGAFARMFFGTMPSAGLVVEMDRRGTLTDRALAHQETQDAQEMP